MSATSSELALEPRAVHVASAKLCCVCKTTLSYARWPLILAILLWCVGCERSDTGAQRQPDPGLAVPPHAEPERVAEPAARVSDPRVEAYAKAEAELERLLALPSLPGAPRFEKNRAQLVARAKSEPIVLLTEPQPDPDMSPALTAVRQHFQRTDYAWRTLRDLRQRFKRNKPALRQLLLSDGYLYSDRPNHAFTMVSLLSPSTLFDEETIWIQRGERLFHAELTDSGYVFTDGSERGKRVRLLHLDRVGTGRPSKPLHVDFRSLRYRLYFDRARLRHATEDHVVADLLYGEFTIPTILRRDGAHLELLHELVPPEQADAFAAQRRALERRLRAITALRRSMRAAIDEGLPFDEPKTEFGQEDGKLRRLWMRAYMDGQNSFRFNDDRYSVFSPEGFPLVPQVCIDFMVDTFQRAGGSWWRDESFGVRERTVGKLDWGDIPSDHMRRTQFFVNFASERPEWFETLHIPEAERIELGYKDRFFEWLESRVEHFAAGDIILIRGLTPWDEVDEHTHSFFVYENDPMTGVPVAIAGNAGPANLWSWETEARRTPHRTLRTRIRPRLEWLETFIETKSTDPLSPPELVSGKK